MKKMTALLLTMVLCFALASCAAEPEQPEVYCGHEQYQPLLEALEQKDYEMARKLIDQMEGIGEAAPEETPARETESAGTQPSAVAAGNPVVADLEQVSLDRQNLLDYFDLQEEYIFEDTVKCYQHFLLKEEYRKRLLEASEVTIEISGFDATAYGELDEGDQLFFLSRYEMTTGELTYRNVHITNNGEGHIVLTEYDEKNRCFEGYLMDIAITEVSGQLVLKGE